jgi:hypothetical protein|nr:MAG TPA: hypothetical protein [Caudoviricetes sp.]
MTIDEKAKIYAGYDIPHSRDMVTIAKMNRKYVGFKAGARWMLDKAIKWLKENAQNYYEDAACHDNCWYDDEQMIEVFQKAMEE